MQSIWYFLNPAPHFCGFQPIGTPSEHLRITFREFEKRTFMRRNQLLSMVLEERAVMCLEFYTTNLLNRVQINEVTKTYTWEKKSGTPIVIEITKYHTSMKMNMRVTYKWSPAGASPRSAARRNRNRAIYTRDKNRGETHNSPSVSQRNIEELEFQLFFQQGALAW